MRRAVATGLLAACLAATPGVAAPDGRSACPEGFMAWAVDSTAEPGTTWRGRFLGIAAGLVVMDEVEIELRRPRLSAEEARWFDPPVAPVASGVAQREWTFFGDEAEALCESLPAGVRKLAERARAVCFTLEGGQRVSVRRDADMTAETDPRGVTLGAGMHAAGDDECVEMDPTASLDDLDAPPDVPEGFLAGVADLLDRIADRPALERRDFAAIPAVRTDLTALAGLAKDSVPGDLPPPWVVAAAVAPPDYAEALLLERATDAPATAMYLLADVAGPGAVRSLRLLVAGRTADDEARGTAGPLALRALIRADPGAARQAAVPALAHTSTRRAALGVLALGDPDIAAALEELDTADPVALREAAERTLAGLAAAGHDDAIREAARAVIEAGLE